MHNIKTLEKYYNKYLKNLSNLTSDSFILINLKQLHDLELLEFHQIKSMDFGLTRYFQVVETPDKITLVNDEFIIWIVPENIENQSITYSIVALNTGKEPKFELAFLLSGVYNTSHLVLSVLERYLLEIQENEELIHKLH